MRVADNRDSEGSGQDRQGKLQTTMTGKVADNRDRERGRQKRQGWWQTTETGRVADTCGQQRRQGRRQTATGNGKATDSNRDMEKGRHSQTATESGRQR